MQQHTDDLGPSFEDLQDVNEQLVDEQLVDEQLVEQPAAAVSPVGTWTRLQQTEPVRLWLYPVATAVLALLVALGLVDDTLAPLYEAIIGAVLAVGAPVVVEGVRASVFSPRSTTRVALAAGRAGAAAEREHALTLTTRAVAAASRRPAVPQ